MIFGINVLYYTCNKNTQKQQIHTMKVSIFYLNDKLRYFGDDEQNVVTRMNYENGVREMTDEELNVEKHYTEVASFELSNEQYPDVNDLLNDVFYTCNSGVFAQSVTKKIYNGEFVNVGHSSMSVGDIVKVDEDMYIVEGVGFRKIN